MSLKESMMLCVQAKALFDKKQYDKSVELYRQSIAAEPQNGVAYLQCTQVLFALGKLKDVVLLAKGTPKAIYSKNNQIIFLHAKACYKLGKFTEAVEPYNTCLDTGNTEFEIFADLADCYIQQNNYQSAVETYVRALENFPKHEGLIVCIANLYICLGQDQKAGSYFQQALSLFPNSSALHVEYANYLQRIGHFEDAKQHLNYRWDLELLKADRLNQKLLNGIKELSKEDKACKVFVSTEQGIGDQIVFSKYLGLLSKDHEKVIFSCNGRLANLFSGLFDNVEAIDRSSTDIEKYISQCDRYIYTGDLLSLYDKSVYELPADKSILHIKPERNKYFVDKYQSQFAGQYNVGIAWKSKAPSLGAYKTVDLNLLDALFAVDKVAFFNLQYGDVTQELSQLSERTGVTLFDDPEVDNFENIEGLAQQISALDLVITTSNVTAHIAAAQGKETWLMLPKGHGVLWYWMYSHNQAGWYPSAKLFFQEDYGDWQPVVGKLAQLLKQRVQTLV